MHRDPRKSRCVTRNSNVRSCAVPSCTATSTNKAAAATTLFLPAIILSSEPLLPFQRQVGPFHRDSVPQTQTMDGNYRKLLFCSKIQGVHFFPEPQIGTASISERGGKAPTAPTFMLGTTDIRVSGSSIGARLVTTRFQRFRPFPRCGQSSLEPFRIVSQVTEVHADHCEHFFVAEETAVVVRTDVAPQNLKTEESCLRAPKHQ